MICRNSSNGRGWIILAALAIALAMLIAPGSAHAQEQYQLKNGHWQAQKTYPPNSPQGQLQTIRKKLAENDADAAADLAQQWLTDHPKSPLRPQGLLLSGDAKVAQQYYYDSLYDYEDLIRQYPASDEYQTALKREYEIAHLFVHGMKRLFLGMRILPAEGEGEELLIRIQERSPGSALGEKASLELADYYYREDDMPNAATAYDLFLENYPQSPKRQWAMLQLIRASLARFKGPGFDPTGLLDAQQRLKTYQKEFPAAAERIGAKALLIRIHASLASNDLQTAQWYAKRGENVSAATLYRRLVKDYPQTAAAKQALAQLEQMHAAVVAPPAGAESSDKAASQPTHGEKDETK